MNAASTIYVGHVVHLRLRPRRHRLRYGCFWLLLDLDDIPALAKRLRLFSHNRAGLVSFYDRDHGDRVTPNIKDYVSRKLAEAGIDIEGGLVRLLCMPRVAGYGFNPVSIYFCHAADGTVRAVLWEVSNTFGERHSYLIEASPAEDGVIRQHCEKCFFVSPFMDLDLTYEFRVSTPGDDISVVIRTNDADGTLLIASLSGKSQAITDRNLIVLLARQPFHTLKVMGAIHWEALKLWLKGVGLRSKPPPPQEPVTVVAGAPASAVAVRPSAIDRYRPVNPTT